MSGQVGCRSRGGNPHGKEYEGQRHKKRTKRRASAIEKAHETRERRAGKREIASQLAD